MLQQLLIDHRKPYFVLYVGTKKFVKRKEFEEFLNQRLII